MPSKTATKKRARPAASATGELESYLATLDHPLKPEVLALRKIILGTDARIKEGVKWNAPSFRLADDFATFNLRAKDKVQIILHLGAKKRDNTARLKVDDPQSLLRWLATDRAIVTFTSLREVEAKRSAFIKIIRQWSKQA